MQRTEDWRLTTQPQIGHLYLTPRLKGLLGRVVVVVVVVVERL